MHHILGTFPKYYTKIAEMDTTNIQIHERSLSWLKKNKTTESTWNSISYFTLQHHDVSLLNLILDKSLKEK